MRNANFVVVGDIFKNLQCAIAGVLSESEAIEMILQFGVLKDDVVFRIAQGVNVSMLEHAIKHQRMRVPEDHGSVVLDYGTEMPRAVSRLAHKTRAENICVSFPRRLSEHVFELDLHFSAQNEMFLDHMTGVHLQGMVLTEAARQAFLTVSEEYFLKDSREKWYFVTHRVHSEFQQFVFPLPAKLHYEIKKHTVKHGRQTFDVDMAIYQADLCCCSFDVSFTTFEAKQIAKREIELMSDRVFDLLNTPKSERAFSRTVHALADEAAAKLPS